MAAPRPENIAQGSNCPAPSAPGRATPAAAHVAAALSVQPVLRAPYCLTSKDLLRSTRNPSSCTHAQTLGVRALALRRLPRSTSEPPGEAPVALRLRPRKGRARPRATMRTTHPRKGCELYGCERASACLAAEESGRRAAIRTHARSPRLSRRGQWHQRCARATPRTSSSARRQRAYPVPPRGSAGRVCSRECVPSRRRRCRARPARATSAHEAAAGGCYPHRGGSSPTCETTAARGWRGRGSASPRGASGT